MTQVLIDEAVETGEAASVSIDLHAHAQPPALSEEALDRQENQGRSAPEAARLDVTLVGLAVTLTAAVVAGVVGLVNLI